MVSYAEERICSETPLTNLHKTRLQPGKPPPIPGKYSWQVEICFQAEKRAFWETTFIQVLSVFVRGDTRKDAVVVPCAVSFDFILSAIMWTLRSKPEAGIHFRGKLSYNFPFL